MSSIADAFRTGMEEIRETWGWFLGLGILLMVLGVACVAKAQTATTFSILALGWVLAISAAFWLITTFQTLGGPLFFMSLLNAIIRGVTGYLLIRHPDAGAEGVTMVLAALFIVGGLFRAFGAGAIRFPWWGLTVFAGIVSIGLGMFILATWETSSTFFVGMAIGIDLIFDGGALTGFAGAIYHLPKAQAFRTV